MDFGLQLPLFTHYDDLTIDDVVDYAKYAREAGMTSFFSIYHLTVSRPLYQTSWFDPLVTLSALASRIDDVEVGPLIHPAPYEHPIHVAKKYATLDQITDGRVILGLGAGWDEHEFEALGIPKRERGKRTEECIEIIQRLWSEDNVTYDGDIYAFEDVSIEPKADIPIWHGGGTIDFEEVKGIPTPNTLWKVHQRIARYSDAWVPPSLNESDTLRKDYEKIKNHCQEVGRDPNDLSIIYQNHICVLDNNDKEEIEEIQTKFERFSNLDFEHIKKYYLIGTIDEIIKDINNKIEATNGVDRVVLAPIDFDKNQIDAIEKHIIPNLRQI